MGQLFGPIRQLIADEKYVVGDMLPSGWKSVVSWSGRWSLDWRTAN